MALTDPALPVERRAAIVEELLGRQGAADQRRRSSSFVVAAGRGHDLPAIVDQFVELAAAERAARGRRGARRRSRSTTRRSSGSPRRSSSATGKQVEVKVIVDPTVLGGIVATIGDTVIDGTVRHRLEQLKEQL